MPAKRKSWREKFEGRRSSVVQTLTVPFAGMRPGQRMLVSHPAEIDAYLRSIPVGQSRTTAEVRADLASRHGAEVTCPTTLGIYLRIISEIALEDLAAGRPVTEVSPFWRVVDPASPLAAKLPGGPDAVRGLRAAEGL